MKEAFGKLWATNLDDELKTFRSKLNHLKALELDNLTVAKNAEIQPGKKQRKEVELWFTHVKEKKSELQRIETELRQKGPSRNLKKRIEDETKEVEELILQGKFPKGVVLDDHESTRIPLATTSLVGQSCTENIKSILRLLKEDGVSKIGVYGMGGVGKTALLKQIHDNLLTDDDSAGQVYWVTASRDCSLEKLQNEIGKVVGLDLSQEHKERKKALLFQRFFEMEKSVIILDDLWKHYLPEQVGIPLESCSCKTVVTTRSLDVCRRMGCQEIIKIKPLLEEDAWKLFAKHSGAIPSHVNELAKEIVEECGGLPLALITMGCCARAYDTIHDWENALYELRRPINRQEVMDDEVFRVLNFSFDSLKDQKVQNCFLCCTLFPEDEEITREYLVDFWIDAGLLDEVQSRQDQESRGHAILNRLINSCLLESTSNYDVHMHDLVRDLTLIISQNHPCFMSRSGEQLKKVPEEEQWSKDLVRVSLSHNKIEEIPNMAPLTPELSVLMLNGNPLKEIPESFFVHMRTLTVLDFSRTSIQRLPESVSNLENLRAFILASCYQLKYVPSLVNLSKLRVLDLEEDELLEKAPKGISRLKCLEKVSYCPWDISDSTGFNRLIHSSPSLSCYRFWLHDPKLFKTIKAFSQTYCCELFWEAENVVLVTGAEIEDNKTTYLLPATIETLEIYKCDANRRSLGDVFPTLGVATNWRKLCIDSCKGLNYISSSSLRPQQGFSIEDLYLRDLPDLRRIAEFGGCSFSNLCSLVIKYCPKIKVVFPLTEKQFSLSNLKELKVSDCEEVEEIFESNKGNHPSPVLALPNLTSLQINFLPKLRRLCMDMHHCTSLQMLKVWNCEELEEIFESSGSSSSSSSISQGDTETLLVDPLNACDPKPNPISSLPELRIINLENLPKLGSIYKDLHLCTSLEEIFVGNCPKVERIFEAAKPILVLHSLKVLYLPRLPNLSIIHKGLLLCTSLKNLIVEGCLKLKRVPLSHHLICDDSLSTLLSLPSESDNPKLWELLWRDYSMDACILSNLIRNHAQLQERNQNKLKLKRKWSNPEDACVFTDYINQVSRQASLPAADDDDNDDKK